MQCENYLVLLRGIQEERLYSLKKKVFVGRQSAPLSGCGQWNLCIPCYMSGAILTADNRKQTGDVTPFGRSVPVALTNPRD